MAQALKRYEQRAPRYLFKPDDRKVVRFAKVGNKKRSSTTILIDISQSGMAFVVEKKLRPAVGDKIMVEFTVPCSDQMACYAVVMRVDLRESRYIDDEDEAVVAVKFTSLMNSQGKNLSAGLRLKFKELKSLKQRERILDKMDWAKESYHKYVFWAVSTVAMIMVFYFIIHR